MDDDWLYTATGGDYTISSGGMDWRDRAASWGWMDPDDWKRSGFQGGFAENPCCPKGCNPCGSSYYITGRHHDCCCKGGACATPREIAATRAFLEKWLTAEREHNTVQWLIAEQQYHAQVGIWLEAEQEFIQSLTPRQPKVVHLKRKENSPAKVKHVKAMQAHER